MIEALCCFESDLSRKWYQRTKNKRSGKGAVLNE